MHRRGLLGSRNWSGCASLPHGATDVGMTAAASSNPPKDVHADWVARLDEHAVVRLTCCKTGRCGGGEVEDGRGGKASEGEQQRLPGQAERSVVTNEDDERRRVPQGKVENEHVATRQAPQRQQTHWTVKVNRDRSGTARPVVGTPPQRLGCLARPNRLALLRRPGPPAPARYLNRRILSTNSNDRVTYRTVSGRIERNKNLSAVHRRAIRVDGTAAACLNARHVN
mmetsp:Transcript_16523/g.51702  ORF Transcript_16523/g.51702 Transcript_16523/m.51702 type:complete len:226 (+) Transcript_16523:306-983(+)